MKSDKELLDEIKLGNELAFASLYNRYKQPLYAYCIKMIRDKDAAKDIVHDVFIKVYENHLSIISTNSFKPWLFTVTRNQCINYIRKSKKFADIDLINEQSDSINVHDIYTGKEKSEIIKNALDKLKYDERELIIFREYLDYSYEEIAKTMDTTTGAVKARLFKVRKKLFEILQPIYKRKDL